jgi:hypothetical protein
VAGSGKTPPSGHDGRKGLPVQSVSIRKDD